MKKYLVLLFFLSILSIGLNRIFKKNNATEFSDVEEISYVVNENHLNKNLNCTPCHGCKNYNEYTIENDTIENNQRFFEMDTIKKHQINLLLNTLQL